jgi:hypothetical protein
MALLACLDCSTRFAVGLSRCPHCQSTNYEEDGAMSPKITVHGGPSIAGATVVGGSWSNEGDADVWPEPANEEGGEESSPGSSSETSPEMPSSDSEPSETPTPKRARTTASRSKKGQTDSSSAPSTGGGQADGTSAADES